MAMSHEATNWAFKQRGLRPSARVVLLYLANRHNPDHGCFPSQDQLAADCEISRSGLNVILDELTQKGLIRRERRVNPGTRKQMSTRYILGFESDFPQEPSPETGHGNPPEPSPESGHVIGQKPCPKQPEPCPKNAESRVQNLDTNLVREPVITTAHARASGALDRCLAVCGMAVPSRARRQLAADGATVAAWLAAGWDLEQDVLPVVQARSRGTGGRIIQSWGYFTRAIGQAHARRMAALRAGQAAESQQVGLGAPDSDSVAHMAGLLNSGRYVPPSAVNTTMRDALLARGLVTRETLRAYQIY